MAISAHTYLHSRVRVISETHQKVLFSLLLLFLPTKPPPSTGHSIGPIEPIDFRALACCHALLILGYLFLFAFCVLIRSVWNSVTQWGSTLLLFFSSSFINLLIVGYLKVDIPYILENLEPQTMYSFRFASKNQVGFSEWSREETHTMPKRAAPEEPYIIAKTENKVVSTPYQDRYELLWSAPPNNGEPIDYFEVAYYPVRHHLARLSIRTLAKWFSNLCIWCLYLTRLLCVFRYATPLPDWSKLASSSALKSLIRSRFVTRWRISSPIRFIASSWGLTTLSGSPVLLKSSSARLKVSCFVLTIPSSLFRSCGF